jgi:hypothetical protein
MKLFQFIIIILLALAGCADPAPEVISSDRLTTSVYTTMITSQTAYCSLAFYKNSDLSSNFFLEEDSIVACDGVEARLSGSAYTAQFPHSAGKDVKVTTVRPRAGATVIEYFPLQ